MNKTSQLIGSSRYKLAPNTDTNLQIQLDGTVKPLVEYDVIDIVNLHNLFQDERDKSKKYRFNGKLNIYTSNVLSPDAKSNFWNPLLYGTPAVEPNNWVMQITYPSTMDSDFSIKAFTQSGLIVSPAFRGFQYESLNITNINSDDKLTITGIQSHNLSVGDYVYLYSNTSFNPLQGIHKIEKLGIDGSNKKTNLTLETITNLAPTGVGNFVKIVDPSFDDVNFTNSSSINLITTTDVSGLTTGSYTVSEPKFVMLTTIQPHNLLVNDFVDIRTNSANVLNGTWRVYNVIGTTNFIIKLDISQPKGTIITPTPYPSWRRLDGTPSEYYIRNFEVLTSNIYDVYPCAFSTNTYSDISDTTIGTANETWMFQFNNDVSVERIRDNRGGPISEMYYTITKRAGTNPYNWSNVTADWDFNYKTTNTTNGIETISINNPTGVGSIEKFSARTETLDSNGEIQSISGSKYMGDFIDYNSKEIKETKISEIIHRFGLQTSPDTEGYYYKPFKKLDIRVYSNVIESADAGQVVVDIPENFVTYADGSYAWRDLLTIGYIEEGTNGVDYPFVNGSHYFYFNHNLYIRRQSPPVIISQDGVGIITDLTEEC